MKMNYWAFLALFALVPAVLLQPGHTDENAGKVYSDPGNDAEL